jgi:hypothetical protein
MNDTHSKRTQHARPTRHVRAQVPYEVHEAASHLGIDLGMGMGEMILDGLLLFLRYHGRDLELDIHPRTTFKEER